MESKLLISMSDHLLNIKRKLPILLDLDVLCLNKTRLSSNISDCEINIENYIIYRKDRNREGGGVAIYVKSDVY